jgi:hypothetical protein
MQGIQVVAFFFFYFRIRTIWHKFSFSLLGTFGQNGQTCPASRVSRERKPTWLLMRTRDLSKGGEETQNLSGNICGQSFPLVILNQSFEGGT